MTSERGVWSAARAGVDGSGGRRRGTRRRMAARARRTGRRPKPRTPDAAPRPTPQLRSYTDTTVNGIPESVVMSRDDGATPARTHAEPSAAIIAPLSVQ